MRDINLERLNTLRAFMKNTYNDARNVEQSIARSIMSDIEHLDGIIAEIDNIIKTSKAFPVLPHINGNLRFEGLTELEVSKDDRGVFELDISNDDNQCFKYLNKEEAKKLADYLNYR